MDSFGYKSRQHCSKCSHERTDQAIYTKMDSHRVWTSDPRLRLWATGRGRTVCQHVPVHIRSWTFDLWIMNVEGIDYPSHV